jgi:hypothetical protein
MSFVHRKATCDPSGAGLKLPDGNIPTRSAIVESWHATFFIFGTAII